MHRVIVLALVLLVGCAASKRTVVPADAARVISLTPLPPVSSLSSVGGIRIEVMFLVRPDGSVADVRMLESSNDPAWDLAAADSMRLWKFALQEIDTSEQAIWVRTNVVVQVQEPTVMTLAELTFDSRQDADSVYALLNGGIEFSALAREMYSGPSPRCKWFLGSVNIARYPRHIREVLVSLAVNEFTSPLPVDSQYAIYMRLDPSTRQTPPND